MRNLLDLLPTIRSKFGLSILLIFLSTIAYSQTRTVTGRITDADSKPLANATVGVKGTKVFATTNTDGLFSISVPAHANTLVVTYVGYQTTEIILGASDVANASLQIQNSAMNEIVVIGYGTQKRKDVTGAISSITASQIEKLPVTTVNQAIQGRAAGVQVINNDASPGGNVSVIIRGIGSLARG